jgi:carbon storage regulator
MLVLSRKAGQSIMIGSNIRVVVVRLERDHVELGIEAPREVPVRRFEVFPPVGKDSAEADTPRDANGDR